MTDSAFLEMVSSFGRQRFSKRDLEERWSLMSEVKRLEQVFLLKRQMVMRSCTTGAERQGEELAVASVGLLDRLNEGCVVQSSCS